VNKFSPLTEKIVAVQKANAPFKGRNVFLNEDGSRSSERSRTFNYPKGSNSWYNYPSVHGGKELDFQSVINMFRGNFGVDPETNINYGASPYAGEQEAINAAIARSSGAENIPIADYIRQKMPTGIDLLMKINELNGVGQR
jgi:hypothetical protein